MATKVSVKRANDVDATNAYTVETDNDILGKRTWNVHTNREGDGLWINGKQTLGTAQFTVAGLKNPAGKIRQYFVDYYKMDKLPRMR